MSPPLIRKDASILNRSLIQSLRRNDQRLLGALCLAMVLGMLTIGLWPFDYSPSNNVAWLEGKNGIRFSGRGVALAHSDTPLSPAESEKSSFIIEILLTPARSYGRGIPHILTLCDGDGREVLYLGQWKDQLIVRVLDSAAWRVKVVKEIGSPADLLLSGKPILVTLASGEGSTKLFADGVAVREFKDFDLAGVVRNNSVHSIILGNSSFGDSPWRGDVLGMAVLGRGLGDEEARRRFETWTGEASHELNGAVGTTILYSFKEGGGNVTANLAENGWDLHIPRTLVPLRREWLSVPPDEFFHKRAFVADAFVNLFGFAPAGFALALFFAMNLHKKNRSRVFTLSVITGAALSLFIEANQAFLVSRNSSLIDLLLNTAGAVGGALAMLLWHRKNNGHG